MDVVRFLITHVPKVMRYTMEKILSVAVAVYNLEGYVSKCLDSIIASKYIHEIEILVINDGSTDNSGKVISEYEKRFPDSIRVFNKEDEGYGSTYNLGFKEAKGKFYKVVDGDDWVETKAFDKYVEFLKATDSDMIATNMLAISDYNGKTKSYSLKTKSKNYIQNGKEYDFDAVCLKARAVDIHHLTVKTEYVRNIKVQNANGWVDTELCLYIIPYVNTITYLDLYVHNYRTAREGQAISMESQKKLVKVNEFVLSKLIDFYNNLPESISGIKRKYIFERISKVANTQYYVYLGFKCSNKVLRQMLRYDKKLKLWNKYIYNNCNIIVKTLRTMTSVSYPLLSFVYKIYKKNKQFL